MSHGSQPWSREKAAWERRAVPPLGYQRTGVEFIPSSGPSCMFPFLLLAHYEHEPKMPQSDSGFLFGEWTSVLPGPETSGYIQCQNQKEQVPVSTPPGLLPMPGRDAVSREICHFYHINSFLR